MPTRQTRTQPNTQYQGRRNIFSYFLDFLRGNHNNKPDWGIMDHNGNPIIVHTEQGFQQIHTDTPYSNRGAVTTIYTTRPNV